MPFILFGIPVVCIIRYTGTILLLYHGILIIIIKGHSLRRACLQPATNTQSSKPRPPTMNTKSKGKLQNKMWMDSESDKAVRNYVSSIYEDQMLMTLYMRITCT